MLTGMATAVDIIVLMLTVIRIAVTDITNMLTIIMSMLNTIMIAATKTSHDHARQNYNNAKHSHSGHHNTILLTLIMMADGATVILLMQAC